MNRRDFLTVTLASVVVMKCGPTAGEGRRIRQRTDLVRLSNDEWRELLTDDAYVALREGEPEPPYGGVWWDWTADGTYQCAGCGLELFDARDKLPSTYPWPSFHQPAASSTIDEVVEPDGRTYRVTLRCARCEGHLGRLFFDAPSRQRTRYRIHSAALDFSPRRDESVG